MKSTLVIKQAGLIIPKETLEKVLHEAAPTCLGIAAYSKGASSLLLNHWPALQDIGGTMPEIAGEIMQLQEDEKEGILLMSFSDEAGTVTVNDDQTYDTPEMMPYPLLSDDSDGSNHLVFAATGDFSLWSHGKDGETPDIVHAIKDDLMPRLGELFEESDFDLAKLMARIRKSQSFQKDIKKLAAGETGVFTLFSSDGDMFTLSAKDDLIVNNGWGWTTHKPLQLAAAQEVGKPRSKLSFGGLFRPKSEAQPAPAPVQDVPKAVPTTPSTPSPTETTPAPVTVETYQPDAAEWGRLTNKEKKHLYGRKAGFTPNNWRQRPKVDIRLPVKSLSELNKIAAIQNGSATAEVKPKDTEPHIVKSEMTKPVESKTPWLIPVAIREKMMKDGVILKIVGRSSEIVNTIEEIKATEKKYSSFSEQMPKLGLEGLIAATPQEMEHIAFTYPEAIPAILIAYRSCFIKLKEMEKAQALKTQEAAPAPAPTARPKLSLGRPSAAA